MLQTDHSIQIMIMMYAYKATDFYDCGNVLASFYWAYLLML